ncbi:hypothetical protein B0I26_103337 [Anoxybacillus vitaminiphilus]|uniref:Uncharacterized protein n=1 Tax=Paranoxybacillus vitaminiphilus TaxID=581036 RepID=A0A327YNZ5_9BACL|nr:hypothetical protein [Anoxybacillus vitaminiphilus]RAK21375.1 hypothetical protein B0I26_103337 [Anoxybacillus vitaminiphilus]
MKPFLFAFAALIVLIPILFVLPLGFNRRGKLIIVVVSFCLASFGLLAKSILPLWQVALLLLLLALPVAYLLDKRLGHLLYAAQEQEAEDDLAQIFAPSLSSVESGEAEEKTIVEEQMNDDGQPIKDATAEPVPALPAIDMTESQLESEQQNDSAEEKWPVFEDDDRDDHIEVDEEIQFLENRLQWLEPSSEPLANYDKEGDDIASHLSEIETWLLEEEKRESVHEEAVTNGAIESANSNDMNVSESETFIGESAILADNDFIPELNFEDDRTHMDVEQQDEEHLDKGDVLTVKEHGGISSAVVDKRLHK